MPGETLFLALVRVRQQVVRGNQNLAATLYESALLSDARAARKTAHLLHVAEMSMQVEATTRVDKILRFRSISGACLWIRAHSSLQTRTCSCIPDGRFKAFAPALSCSFLSFLDRNRDQGQRCAHDEGEREDDRTPIPRLDQ